MVQHEDRGKLEKDNQVWPFSTMVCVLKWLSLHFCVAEKQWRENKTSKNFPSNLLTVESAFWVTEKRISICKNKHWPTLTRMISSSGRHSLTELVSLQDTYKLILDQLKMTTSTASCSTFTQPDAEDVCLLVGCLTSQQHVSVSQGWICSDNCTCCNNEIEVADQTFHHTQSQYTDTRPTSPSTDPKTPGAWQGSHWSANF